MSIILLFVTVLFFGLVFAMLGIRKSNQPKSRPDETAPPIASPDGDK